MIGSKPDEITNEYLAGFEFHPREKHLHDASFECKRSASFHKSIKDSGIALFYRLTSKNISKSLQYIRDCFSISENNIGKQIPEGVSDAVKTARTQMAQAKQTSRLFGAVAGAAMTAAAVFTPVASSAQEVIPVANTAESTRAAELSELRAADRAATEYAQQHGVAILLVVGMDMQNHEQPDALLQWVQNDFKERFAQHGIEVGIFPRMNDSAGSGLVYHVGDHIYSPRVGNATLNLQEAANLVPDVVEQARIALELADANVDTLQPNQPGG